MEHNTCLRHWLFVCKKANIIYNVSIIDSMNNKENRLINFIKSPMADNLFLALTCATAFTVGMCHWWLEIEYKYRENINPALAIVDFRWVFVLGVIISAFYLYRKREIKFDFTLLMLVISLLLVGLLDYHSQRYSEVCYAFIIPMAYMIGKLVVGTDATKVNYRIEKLYFSLAAGMFIAAFMDFLSNYIYASEIGFNYGAWPSFWLGGIIDNRCTYEFGFFLITISTGYLIYSSRRSVFALIAAIFFNLIIQKLVIEATGRENRAVLPAGIILVILLILYDNWDNYSAVTKRRVLFVERIIVVLCVLLFFAVMLNLFGLGDIYKASIWAARSGFVNNMRFSMDWEGFKAMLKYPLEDYETYAGLSRPHSMILEYGREYDLSVWGLLTITRLLMIKDALVFATVKNDKSWIKYLLFPAFVAVNLYYSMEPNGYAHRHFWMVGIFISGMIRGWTESNSVAEKNVLACIKDFVSVLKRHKFTIIKVVISVLVVVGVYKGINYYSHIMRIHAVEEALADAEANLDNVELEDSDIYTVNVDGGGDYKTISEAISKAEDDDVILIYPGVYEESIDTNAKKVHIIGLDKDKCILSYSGYENYPLRIAKGSVTNLTIRGAAEGIEGDIHFCAVVVDDDNSAGQLLQFNNVRIINECAESISIGLRRNFTVEINGCEIISKESTALYCFDWENDSGVDNEGQRLLVKNSNLESNADNTQIVRLVSRELQTRCAECIFINNVLINPNCEDKIGVILWEGRSLTNNQFMGTSDWFLGRDSSGNNVELLNYKNEAI